MEKIIMVDGNNLLFRSYYATAYSGNFMKNSKGFPTNGLLGFTNMMNKIITEEKPTHIIVAFDKGKTFRHDMYEFYKDGRSVTPDELKVQFPVAKEMLTAMGIKYYEIDDYEADDIIGTFAAYCDAEDDFIGTIISSDRDLLQLISKDVDIKLLRQKDHIWYNYDTFIEEYGYKPKHVVDLKALMGDSSDNIPGVKGIGEVTGNKLIKEYKTLDNVYDNIENIKGVLQKNLIENKEMAYTSHDLASIVTDVPMEIHIEDIIYKGINKSELLKIYQELEFMSLIERFDLNCETEETKIKYKVINSLKEINTDKPLAAYLEILGSNYHTSEVLGLALYNEDTSVFIEGKNLKYDDILTKIKYTYDYKKMYVSFLNKDIKLNILPDDLLISAYLLEYNVKEDIASLALTDGISIDSYDSVYGKTRYKLPDDKTIIEDLAVRKAKYIFENINKYNEELVKEKVDLLYYDIELPLTKVLGDMEYAGINVDVGVLDEIGAELTKKIEELTKKIHELSGLEFNIASPKQLGDVLFEHMKLSSGKKTKTGYSTAQSELIKIKNDHEIIDYIIEYRTITKLYSTYVEGLKDNILKDGKIHTIYMQGLTRTGRLSSTEPNLQNIPIRYEEGKLIRKAFLASDNHTLLASDYSQIELRIFAHIAKIDSLKEAFINKDDIHTKTAADIFGINKEDVTSKERRVAKAVNFGIIYGISPYGLSENLEIPLHEAKEFIDTYLDTYPGVKTYMDDTIKNSYKDFEVRTILGRIRKLDELRNKNYMIRQSGERMALNTPVQGTAADIIKLAMVKIASKFKALNLKSKMILQVHDELIFDVANEELNTVTDIIKEEMENVYKLDVPLITDISTGNNWYEL